MPHMSANKAFVKGGLYSKSAPYVIFLARRYEKQLEAALASSQDKEKQLHDVLVIFYVANVCVSMYVLSLQLREGT